jgi:hypothetical protein
LSEGRTVLGLIEAREGIRIDERKLSAKLCGRIGKVDEMLVVFDKLKVEVEASKRRRGGFFAFLSITGAFGVVGGILGVMGLLEGFLPFMDSLISLVAAIGIFIVDAVFVRSDRKLLAVYLKRKEQVEEVSNQLDDALDRIYDEIVAELSSVRNQMLGGPRPKPRVEP